MTLIAPAPYQQAIDVIVLMTAGFTVQSFGMFMTVQLAYSKQAYRSLPAPIVGAGINIMANLVLVPTFGVAGAAFAYAMTVAASTGVGAYIGQRLYRVDYQWSILIPMFATCMASAAVMVAMRNAEVTGGTLYLTKLSLLVMFVLVGLKARVITWNNWMKVYGSLVPARK
jgi:O-antigen/teichoic acid export membrane protein